MEILQTRLPYDARLKPLPGIAPLEPGDWLIVDEAYAAQVAHKLALLATKRDVILQTAPAADPAALELLEEVLQSLSARHDFNVDGAQVICPDGRRVDIDRDDPLGCLAHLVQEDFCILQKPSGGREHVLTAALLGFPASWMLSEKFNRPLAAIHDPVSEYDDNIARRVQRLFDGVQLGRPLWRFNGLWYADPELHQPRQDGILRPKMPQVGPGYFRTERQTVSRLPKTGAVVFGIHTFVLAREHVDEGV